MCGETRPLLPTKCTFLWGGTMPCHPPKGMPCLAMPTALPCHAMPTTYCSLPAAFLGWRKQDAALPCECHGQPPFQDSRNSHCPFCTGSSAAEATAIASSQLILEELGAK